MGVAVPVCQLREADYLEIERRAQFKSEFLDGEMFAMAGGSLAHSLIATNLAGEARHQLKGRPCVPFNSDRRLKVEATGLHTYPDLSVVCGPVRFAGPERDTIVNPTLLAEVMSESTEAYDRGTKFAHYRQMPSLQECLLVSQWEPRIEQFVRQADGQWLLGTAGGMEASLELPSLGITIALGEVYARVEFTPAPLRARTPRRET